MYRRNTAEVNKVSIQNCSVDRGNVMSAMSSGKGSGAGKAVEETDVVGVATTSGILAPVCDTYIGSATLMDLPAEANEMICFRLSNPSDRFSLRAASKLLLPAVDGSLRDVQTLVVVFADRRLTKMAFAEGEKDMASGGGLTESDAGSLSAVPDGGGYQITRVYGTTVDPDTGEQSEFDEMVYSAKLVKFLQWFGPRLPSLSLFDGERYAEEVERRTEEKEAAEEEEEEEDAAEEHPITTVLSACVGAMAVPSVADVSVRSLRLFWDRSLLDALIRWAEHRRHAAHNGDVPFWCSLTLDVGLFDWPLQNRNRDKMLMEVWEANGEPPVDIQMLVEHGFGDVMFDADGPMEADSLSRRWRKGLKEGLIETFRTFGCRDLEGVIKHYLSLLQRLMDTCESLRSLDIDHMLVLLELRPTVIHYPKTLTQLKCNRFGMVAGEIQVIVDNCPLLEKIRVYPSIDKRDIIALTKLKQLKTLDVELRYMSPLEFALAVFGVDNAHQLCRSASESNPWPMLEEIDVTFHLAPRPLIGALIDCCSKLTRFNLYGTITTAQEKAEAETMLDEICRLPRLSQLHSDYCFSGASLFVDRHFDSLINCCPNLQDFAIDVPDMNVTWLTLLLRGCPALRSVDLCSVDLDLTVPAVSAMLLDIAADVGDRERRVVIELGQFVGDSQASLNAIVVAFPPDVRLCHSAYSDECLHGRRRCWRCCFEDDRSKCHSLTIAHCRRLPAAVVFTDKISLELSE